MTDPKEALERLNKVAGLIEPGHRARLTLALVKTYTSIDGLSYLDQFFADLSWLIAEREGLEREVERLTDENEKLRGMPDDDRKSCIALMELLAVARAGRDTYRKTMEAMVEAPDVVASLCARVTVAETEFAAVDHAARTLNLAVDGMWNDSARVKENRIHDRHVTAITKAQGLLHDALLHPTVPVERGNAAEVLQRIETGELDVAPPSQGQLSNNPGVLEGSTHAENARVPHPDVSGLVEAARLASAALDELQARASSFSVSGVYFDEPCFADNVQALTHASDAEDALNAALAALQSHKGGEGDSELAAADERPLRCLIAELRDVADWIERTKPQGLLYDSCLPAMREASERLQNVQAFSTFLPWLDEAAVYFERRPTGGEDSAHWANVYNALNARNIAAAIRAAAGQTPNGLAQEPSHAHQPADNNHKAES
jgi:hypothetical protein